jgi:beta-ureidopropionase / N-carbamoyl-L-amino-acid hydrolase
MTAQTSQMHRIDGSRLHARIAALAEIAPIHGVNGEPGNARLALTDEDKAGRDLVVTWMHDLGLEVHTDGVGNVVATTQTGTGPAVMTGSHIDTVRTGGRFDGNLGVLAGLEVIERAAELGLALQRPLAVAFFTNEEGARFQPDMLGSLVAVGGLSVEEALDTVAIDGARLGDELTRIGYDGGWPCPWPTPHAFIELHVEQGPVLEAEGFTIGAVTGVQGISWQELTITGQSNHAGTTPMRLRRDPAFAASAIAVEVRRMANEIDGQLGTVGAIDLRPNLINVVPASAVITVDLRNTDEQLLQHAEARFNAFIEQLAVDENVHIVSRRLARFEPVVFDDDMINRVEATATALGHSVMRLPSGAGHDAQMMARVCPTSMVFTNSINGISHNPAELTTDEDIEAGANVLFNVMIDLAK